MSDLKVYSENGQLHVRVDRPGERAVSTVVDDPTALITQLAGEAGLDITIADQSAPAEEPA